MKRCDEDNLNKFIGATQTSLETIKNEIELLRKENEKTNSSLLHLNLKVVGLSTAVSLIISIIAVLIKGG